MDGDRRPEWAGRDFRIRLLPANGLPMGVTEVSVLGRL
jgi:hypothetical protein